MTDVAKKPKGARGEAWGILNPYGDIWTHDTFRTADAAMEHVREFWSGFKNDTDLSHFRAIKVKVHVTAVAAHIRDTQS